VDKQEVVEQKIEITHQMIDAGHGEAMGFNPEFDDITELVTDVYRAMYAAYLRGESQSNLSK